MAFKQFKSFAKGTTIFNIYWGSKYFKILDKIVFPTENFGVFKQKNICLEKKWNTQKQR